MSHICPSCSQTLFIVNQYSLHLSTKSWVGDWSTVLNQWVLRLLWHQPSIVNKIYSGFLSFLGLGPGAGQTLSYQTLVCFQKQMRNILYSILIYTPLFFLFQKMEKILKIVITNFFKVCEYAVSKIFSFFWLCSIPVKPRRPKRSNSIEFYLFGKDKRGK